MLLCRSATENVTPLPSVAQYFLEILTKTRLSVLGACYFPSHADIKLLKVYIARF